MVKARALMALVLGSIGAAMGACAADGASDRVDRESVARTTEGLGTREVLTQHNDNFRTGAILSETVLSPATVQPDRFGLRYSRAVDGQIYAQPLYVEGVATPSGNKNLVIAATMQNTIYAFDASNVSTVPTAGVVWRRQWAPPAVTPSNGGFLTGTPTIGIQSTPVIDRANNRLYVVMATTASGRRAYSLYALSLGDGSLLASAPIHGSFRASDGTVTTFDGDQQIQRAGLLLQGDRVYIAFAGFQDAAPYHGWVFGFPGTALSASSVPSVYCTTPDRASGPWRPGGGIWQSGNGLATDATGNIYFMTGNAVNGAAPSRPVGQEESFVKLSTPSLGLAASWAPPNFATIENGDMDLGSGGVLVVPGATPRVIGGGKTGVLYVHDTNLHPVQGFQAFVDTHQPIPSPISITQDGVAFPTSYDALGMVVAPNIHGSPVYFRGSDGVARVYAWAEKDTLKAFPMTSSGVLGTTPVHASVYANAGMPGGTFSISANDASGGIVWATLPEPDPALCTVTQVAGHLTCDASLDLANGHLYAFDAQTLSTLWDASIPLYAKFTPPMIAAGKVYVATFENELRVYGPRPAWGFLDGETIAVNARPSVVATEARMDVFAKAASDSSLKQKTWNGSTWVSGWSPLGGILTSNPSATPSAILVRDLSNGVAYRAGSVTSWRNWNVAPNGTTAYLGGVITSDPAATSWGSGRVDVVARASDGTLAHVFTDGTTWSPWTTSSSASPAPALGHVLAAGARPAIVSWGPGRLDVFARGASQTLLHFAYAGGAWYFDDLGGILASDPDAVSWGSNRLDVFVQAIDHTIAHIAWNSSTWSSWEAAPFAGMHASGDSAPASVSLGSGRIDLFVRASDDSLQHIGWTGSEWTSWESLAGILTSAPVVAKTARGAEVFVRALDGRIATVTHPGGWLP